MYITRSLSRTRSVFLYLLRTRSPAIMLPSRHSMHTRLILSSLSIPLLLCADDFPQVRTKLCFPDGMHLCGHLLVHVPHPLVEDVLLRVLNDCCRTASVTMTNSPPAHGPLGGMGSSPCSKAWTSAQQVRAIRTSANLM